MCYNIDMNNNNTKNPNMGTFTSALKHARMLELDKILHLLSEQAVSDACKAKIAEISPHSDFARICEEADKTSDAFKMSVKQGSPRFNNIADPAPSLIRAGQGGSLSLSELLDIAKLLKQIAALRSFAGQAAVSAAQVDNDSDIDNTQAENSLSYLFGQLTPNKSLLDEIDNAVISENELSDNASPELFRIRRNIDKQSLLIRERLDKLIRNSDTRKFLQDGIVTQRDGRFVVPVKLEHKGDVPGLVHDTSGSGATLFVEPMGVVEANNEIRVLKSKEKDEIERIIAELSAACAGFADELNCGFAACIKLELCFAKANLGARMDGAIPEIVNRAVLDLRKARHPLISAKTVVPVSIEVGANYTSIVVTGPNTGGKTVAIKTAGLLSLMTRCGLMIPAAAGSVVGVVGDIYVDIGDEQSIEQSLSTFSSHMNNIIAIMAEVKSGDLVLLDELGSGTDPSEGGALAVAILDYFKDKGCLVIATTHYQEVKMYALNTDGVENASCEFDVATLKPTYRLITGAPGKSNALAIARRLGLREDVVERAANLVSSEDKRFDDVIAALEESRREVERLGAAAAANERNTREVTEKLRLEREKFAASREKEMQNARQRALSIVESVRASADVLLDELEDLRRDQNKADFSARVKGMRSRVNSTLNKLHDEANPIEKSAVAENSGRLKKAPKLYDTVLLADINKTGTVISLPDSKGNCVVQVGIIKTKTNVSNLRSAGVQAKDNAVTVGGKKLSSYEQNLTTTITGVTRDYGSATELDIRGMTSDEGIAAVDVFVDSAARNHIGSVTVIHGKGTGVLRSAVHSYLRKNKLVKEFRLGRFGEGEDGVTIVTLR